MAPDALVDLSGQGHTCLPCDVVADQWKGGPVLNVATLQECWVRQPGEQLSLKLQAPSQGVFNVHAPAEPHQEPSLVEVMLTLSQAPAAFCLPTLAQRPWDPPFQVTTTWRSAHALQLCSLLEVFSVGGQELQCMEGWVPPTSEDSKLQDATHELSISLAKEPATAGTQEGNAGFTYAARIVTTLSHLQFPSTSQMKPRWLAFALTLPGGGFACCLYKVPTVVLSRAAQQAKAMQLLWGGRAPLPAERDLPERHHSQAGSGGSSKRGTEGASAEFSELRDYIRSAMEALNIRRQLEERDFAYLACKAGFVVGQEGVPTTSPTPGELEAFKAWFDEQLVVIKHCRLRFECLEPLTICGFGVTREVAEEELSKQPEGTFLLRFGTRGGMLVASVRVRGAVEHYDMRASDMQRSSLEALMACIPKFRNLLDITTGKRYPRVEVLDRAYIKAAEEAAARKRYRLECCEASQPEEDIMSMGASTSPPPAEHSVCQPGPPPLAWGMPHMGQLPALADAGPAAGWYTASLVPPQQPPQHILFTQGLLGAPPVRYHASHGLMFPAATYCSQPAFPAAVQPSPVGVAGSAGASVVPECAPQVRYPSALQLLLAKRQAASDLQHKLDAGQVTAMQQKCLEQWNQAAAATAAATAAQQALQLGQDGCALQHGMAALQLQQHALPVGAQAPPWTVLHNHPAHQQPPEQHPQRAHQPAPPQQPPLEKQELQAQPLGRVPSPHLAAVLPAAASVSVPRGWGCVLAAAAAATPTARGSATALSNLMRLGTHSQLQQAGLQPAKGGMEG